MWIQELKIWKLMKTIEEKKGASAIRLVRGEAVASAFSTDDRNKRCSRLGSAKLVRAGRSKSANPF